MKQERQYEKRVRCNRMCNCIQSRNLSRYIRATNLSVYLCSRVTFARANDNIGTHIYVNATCLYMRTVLCIHVLYLLRICVRVYVCV